MNFGVPNQRRRKVEAFPNDAVLTIGIDGGKGTSRAMYLSSNAVETLALPKEGTVAFSFDGGIFIGNGNQPQIDGDFAIKVTKSTPRKISDKRTYDYISKLLSLDTTVENHFDLVTYTGQDGDPTMYELIARPAETSTFSDEATIDENISEEVETTTS